MPADLPIAPLRPAFLEALRAGPVVVSSPTGSGKSTEVPRWCDGRVLVVEPRRVACRTLAARVSDLEGAKLGGAVGYVVRDESVMGKDTRIVFATPGIVLRNRALLERASTILLDEFHERSLDVDLLLALLLARPPNPTSNLVVMSATLEGERVARHVGGSYLAAEGRAFPVDVRYLGRGDALPEASDLVAGVQRGLEAAAGDPGDVLVFLPGKAEIEACRRALERSPFDVIALHGGLTLDEQRRAFEPARRRKVILATNVAETSITIPGVGVVIDAGLARQNRYHEGRGSLVLAPIAEDAAAQRAGRAGRTAPGVCYRLWSPSVALARTTLPEIHRESLVPLVLSAAAWGARVEDLPFLDPPKPYAVAAARADLVAWGALGEEGRVTDGGRDLFALPLDPPLARLLLEARRTGCLEDAIDLVAALSVGRPLFAPGPPPEDPQADLRLAACDPTAVIRAVRIGRADVHRVTGFVVDEARRVRSRLRRLHDLADTPPRDAPVDREALARTAIAADPRVVHIARARGRDVAFSNGGTELELSRESALRNARDVEAIVVFDTRAFGSAGAAGKGTRLQVTCATAIPLSWIARAGLGTDHLGAVHVESGCVVAKVERIYAGRVVAVREEAPTGDVAREAIATLFLRGSIFRDALRSTRERLAQRTLAAKLATRGHPAGVAHDGPVPPLEEWVRARLRELGVESGDDLALLSGSDLVPAELPFESRHALEREFPLVVSVGDATYEAGYDLDRGQVMLRMTRGSRRDPPPLAYLPRFPGLRICVDGPRGVSVIRERG